jgi:hypothetical protein
MTIIVDDFGYNHEANLLVGRALQQNVIDGAAIMVNQLGTDEALTMSRSSSKQFGLHLNLTEGKPLLPVSQVSSLVNQEGLLYPWPVFVRRVMSGSIKKAEVIAEAEAQMKLFGSRRQPDFFNSHHHIHLFPDLFGPLMDLAVDYGVAKIRAPRQIWWPSLRLQNGLKALTIQSLGRSQLSGSLQPMASLLIDLDWSDQRPESLSKMLTQVPADAELICHPHPAPSTLEWLIKQKELSHDA